MKQNILRIAFLLTVLLVIAFTTRPIIGLAQESTAETTQEFLKTLIPEATSSAGVEGLPTAPVQSITDPAIPETVGKALLQVEEVATSGALVLSVQDELNASGEDVDIDPGAIHSCEMETFSATAVRGKSVRFTYNTYTPEPENIMKHTHFLGSMPAGVTGTISPAASKEGKRYDIELNVNLFAQRGSFNIPVFYKITTYGQITSTAVCQLNLIVE